MTIFYRTAETMYVGALTLPKEYFTSALIHQAELEQIFFKRWICVGREQDLPDPGDYFLAEIGAESLIVVRDQQRQIRAHYNVCRHRGTRLCTVERGHFNRSIQCPYHAWTYSLAGDLIGAPHMKDMSTFDKAEFPLRGVSVATWEGFVFVNVGSTPEPFGQAFAPLLGRFAQWRLTELQVVHQIEYDVSANWKLIVQNYSECYHCPLVHPALAALSNYTSGQNDLVEGPFLGGFMDIDHAGGSLTMSGQACAMPIDGLAAEDLDRVYYYAFFPNMLLSLHPDYVLVHHLWPQCVNRTRILCRWFFHPKAMAAPGFNPDDAVGFWDMTNRQDWHVCELSQLGVASRAYTPSPYSNQESLLVAFDRQVLQALALTTPA